MKDYLSESFLNIEYCIGANQGHLVLNVHTFWDMEQMSNNDNDVKNSRILKPNLNMQNNLLNKNIVYFVQRMAAHSVAQPL